MKKIISIFGVVLFLTACGAGDSSVVNNSNTGGAEESTVEKILMDEDLDVVKGDKATTKSGLKYEVLKVGKGERAQNGDKVSVHYTGWLTDGTKFDSSVDRGTPFQFILGKRQVIKGWDEGVLNMRKGESRRLTIPSDLAYGDQQRGKLIAPGSTLIFDVELVKIGN